MSIDRSALDELVKGILEAIGGSVNAIILYGSVARGTAGEESDVDIARIPALLSPMLKSIVYVEYAVENILDKFNNENDLF